MMDILLVIILVFIFEIAIRQIGSQCRLTRSSLPHIDDEPIHHTSVGILRTARGKEPELSQNRSGSTPGKPMKTVVKATK